MPAFARLNKKHALPSTISPPQPTEATDPPAKKGQGLSKLKQLRRRVARPDVKDIIVLSDQDNNDEDEKVVAELAYSPTLAAEDAGTLTLIPTLSTLTNESTISASSTLSSIGSNLSASDLTSSTTVDSALSAGDSSDPTPLVASSPNTAHPTPSPDPAAPRPSLKQRIHTLKHRIIFSPAYNRARIFCAPGRRVRIRITDFLSLSIKKTLEIVFETLPWNIYFYTGKVVFGLGIILAIVAFIVGVELGKI